jgi:hypothetical protein
MNQFEMVRIFDAGGKAGKVAAFVATIRIAIRNIAMKRITEYLWIGRRGTIDIIYYGCETMPLYAVSTTYLSFIESLICTRKQSIRCGALIIQGGNTKTGCDHHRAYRGINNLLCNILSQPFSNLASSQEVAFRQDDGKFITPIACYHVHLAKHLLTAFGHAAQHLIPNGMAIGIVDQLVVINIQHNN